MNTTECPTRTCPTCNTPFQPRRAHHWQCWPCWAKQHAGNDHVKTYQACIAELESQLADKEDYERWLRDEAVENYKEMVKMRDESDFWRRQAELNENPYRLASALNNTRSALPSDFTKQLPRLLQLCHPDRHGNSEASTKATARLLKAREALRPCPTSH